MKVHLFDIENQLNKELLAEAQEVVKTSLEFDISNPEPGIYHCISRQPEYHVEITLKDEGAANAKCHCLIYKKSNRCKHAVAGLLLLRDYLQRNRRTKKKSKQETLDEVLRKLNVSELKSFTASFAMSHSTLRAQILANYLHLTKKPDYNSLYNDLAPVDKYGQFRINRNNIKTVRTVSATLLKRAQQLLKDQSLSEALAILEAVLIHLHRIWSKVIQFQDQIMVELKQAYKLFELLCAQTMAPRLQQRASLLSMEVCGRESYVFPSGMRPLVNITEQFFLEQRTRKEAFVLAEHKANVGSSQKLKWTALLYHWMRIWSYKVSSMELRPQMDRMLPDVIREFSQQGDHDDALYAADLVDKKKYDVLSVQIILRSGLRSAKMLGHKERVILYAYELVLHYLDSDAWDLLMETDRIKALHVLDVIAELYSPKSDEKADMLLLRGWNISGNGALMIHRLKEIGDFNILMEFDTYLKINFKEEVEWIYAEYIYSIREAYGGMMARQKLNNIFSHLKSIDLFQSVADKIKTMENSKQPDTQNEKTVIKGFVFDLDGVIVDTAVHHFESWRKILKELGADLVSEDDHHTRGAGRMESLEYLLDRYDIKLTADEKLFWAAKKNDVYVDTIKSISPEDMLPGALTFIEDSRNMGLLIALGSASKNARSVLEKLGVANRFDAIVDGNDAKASKPDPEVFLKACAALGLDPENVVVFEDAAKGVQAALRAGCKAVGIGDLTTLSAANIVIPGLRHSSPSQIIQQLV